MVDRVRTFEELQHTVWLIGQLKEHGDFEGANQLFEEFVTDVLLYLVSRMSVNETATKPK